jgi:hypothetical protein
MAGEPTINGLSFGWRFTMRRINHRWSAFLATIGVSATLLIAACGSKQRTSTFPKEPSASPLVRRYVEGESTRYIMTGVNRGREHTITYSAEAEARVMRDDQGRFIEEVRWTRLVLAGQEIPLDEASANFRERVSLDPAADMSPPDIAGINPMLIGPVFDLMTFYVDLHPSLHQGRLSKPGDRVHVAHGQPNSWADGANVIIGEDCIDFELTLERVEDSEAVLHVRHVPPRETSVTLPAPWLQERMNPASPNNWVQVQRDGSTTPPRFVAAAGHETFDVVITIDRANGEMISATMDNPVDVVQRHCTDESLTECGELVKFQIRRQIELRRVP